MRITWLAAWLSLALPLAAQVTVEVEFEDHQFVANSEVYAAVRITNFSGRTLSLGQGQDWLELAVEADEGRIVARLSAPDVVEPFEVPNAARGTRWVNLEPHFDMSRPGRYQVTATVRLKDPQEPLVSSPAGVNVISGAQIWMQRFGLPRRLADGTAAMEVRKYSLIQASRLDDTSLYVRVSNDQETQVFRVFALGPVLTFSHPEARVDRAGDLHVLFQIGARNFSYTVVHPDGELAIRRTYQYAGTRPVLRTNPEGKIAVAGGARIPNSLDVPREEEVAEAMKPKNRRPIVVPPPTADDAFGPVMK